MVAWSQRPSRHLLQGGVLSDKSGKSLLPEKADFIPPETKEREAVVNLKSVVEQRRALVRDLAATKRKKGVENSEILRRSLKFFWGISEIPLAAAADGN